MARTPTPTPPTPGLRGLFSLPYPRLSDRLLHAAHRLNGVGVCSTHRRKRLCTAGLGDGCECEQPSYQDHDCSDIKGLLINFIHTEWTFILKVLSFMVEFITPIIKATNKQSIAAKSFDSLPDYEAWKEQLGENLANWSSKSPNRQRL